MSMNWRLDRYARRINKDVIDLYVKNKPRISKADTGFVLFNLDKKSTLNFNLVGMRGFEPPTPDTP